MAVSTTATATISQACGRALSRAGVSPTTALAIACSGGPDSTVLAHAVMALARAGACGPVTLLHVDHGLREGSADDAKVVEALADGGGAAFMSCRVDVDKGRASLEAAAREARYAALADMAEHSGARWVLLAHTASDQAETVLMRILRGTGVAGLAGMPVQRDIYLRPLLDVDRAVVEAYVDDHELDTVHDPMNDDHRFARSRVRGRVLPELRDENPRLDAALVRLAASAREQRDVLDFAAELVLELAAIGDGTMSVRKLRDAPAAVLKRALAIATVRAGGQPLESRHLELLAELCARDDDGEKTLDLPHIKAVRTYDQLSLRPADHGEVRQPGASVRIEVVGDGGPYVVRSWQPGDRMRPVRLKGRSRKLSDLFIDARVPRQKRASARVVVRAKDGEIAWAEHVGPAHGADIDVILTPGQPITTTKV